MGKAEEERSLSAHQAGAATEEEGGESAEGNAGAGCRRCRWIGGALRVRCVAALALGVAVLLSAVFWLPPFLGDGADPDGRDSQVGTNIVASFQLQKPLAELKINMPELQYDIFEEIGVANSSVMISSLDPLRATNWTNVVFGVWPYPKDSNISSAGLSILRSNFVSLVTQQSTLRLTSSLFGDPSFFQVLEFPGGITIIPPQSGFLLQKPQILFNFTLNFSIYEVYNKISELKDQMTSGLHLTYYENLYVSLTNSRGSTVSPPTIIQTSILLSVGNRPPSQLRLKELAQSITPARNLGLNNTVFGRVKQIRLSSFLQHSINGDEAPSSAPQPHPSHHHHHHHHHQHHHHHHHQHHHRQHHHHQHHSLDIHLVPAPAPQYSNVIPPSGCQDGYPLKSKNRSHFNSIAPSVASSHHYSAPHLQVKSPAPTSMTHPESSPIPNVLFTQVEPPSKSTYRATHPEKVPSSCTTACLHFVHWALALFYLFTCL